ncbi:MAG: putative capsular polysaccharide synthesis family protein [Leeuwenhoekiella sp.]
MIKTVRNLPIVRQYFKKKSNDIELSKFKNKLNHIPVFVLQMGKVASSSIYSSLCNQYSGNVIHGHSFRINNPDLKVRTLYKTYTSQNIPLKIITLVREPIGRNLSSFFQNFENNVGIKYEKSPYTIKEIYDLFINLANNDYPLNWFDYQIQNNFGINVYKRAFPPEQGYDHFQNFDKKIELLIMKYDLDDTLKEKLIREFLNLKDFNLINTNISSSKVYSKMYNEIKQMKMPEVYIDRMLNSRYAQHFYANEIGKIRAKWS